MPDYKKRWSKMRSILRDRELDAILVMDMPSVFYFTGACPSRPPGLIISADEGDTPLLMTRAMEAAEMGALTDADTVGAEEGAADEFIAEQLAGLGDSSGVRVGFEERHLNAEAFLALQSALTDCELVPASQLLSEVRLIKEPEEIEHMRDATEVTNEAMTRAVEAIKAGQPECLAASAAEQVMRKNAMSPGYEILIGSGVRSGHLRRYPGDIVPADDDMVRLDLGAGKFFAASFGYYSDVTRTLTPKAPRGRDLAQLEANLAVQRTTLAALRPGVTIAEASRQGLAEVEGSEFAEFTRMAGHGIGLFVHEWPSFNENTEVTLQPGMAFAIEPMIILPGEQATCIEDTVVITETGHERLSTLPQDIWD